MSIGATAVKQSIFGDEGGQRELAALILQAVRLGP